MYLCLSQTCVCPQLWAFCMKILLWPILYFWETGYFDYSVHKCDCWLKIVNHWDKSDNSVLCGETTDYILFKIASNRDRGINTYMQDSLKKKVDNGRSILLFCKFLRIRSVQKSGLFDLEIGLL